MTARKRITEPPDCRLDVAPYLLGALEPGESETFVRHLEHCAACREEMGALAPVLDALAAGAPPRPVGGAPPRPVGGALRRPVGGALRRRVLRRRVLRAARAEPKALARSGREPRRRHRPVRIALGRWAPAGWLALGPALAATLAAALVVELGAGHSRARVISASAGQAELRVSGGHGELIVEHLAVLPADRTYELWLQSGARTVPSTLFGVGADGRADIRVPGDLHEVTRVLVTVEPRRGSLVPTTRAVIVQPLT